MNKNFNEIIIDYLKTYGFIIANSEIYGGLPNSWDYGPLGVILKNNIRDLWWNYFIKRQENVFPMDSSIMLNSKVWQASGHLDNFNDLLIDCKNCQNRFRVDHFLANFHYNNIENKSPSEIDLIINADAKIQCLKCKEHNFTPARKFNLMYKTATKFDHSQIDDGLYLRPETAQNIFINYKTVQRTMRTKLPFAIGQIGKAFRNEITIGNGIFRTREFEQMEIEWFCHPEKANDIFEDQLAKIKNFLFFFLKLDQSKIFFNEIPSEDLAHYSSRTVDIEYQFAQGRSELWGLANRTDFDLKNHQEKSGRDLTYFDETTKEKFIPYVVEPSVGLNRLLLALVTDCYQEETISETDQRIVLKLPTYLAPYSIAILPLTKKQELAARLIFQNLIQYGFSVTYDLAGSIGKRYRRNDAIGTPFCITCDFETFDATKQDLTTFNLNNATVTIRYRDSMKQTKILYKDLKTFLIKELDPFVNNNI
ncbi:glycyl-tRNA synthetase [Mycoplasmoides fastidiosum]|uniref:glycine--tRNA ligase n=1 Tax=Mycoplasmoides fastidiosum TaxID=92758 RepID=A0ABU0LZR3_9BACT|nr:glycine--tRNA ligase [Mycoplasmoides fastidiosum]MDQ0514173.1 glycyl-tRNA synthetase [Mycoplasmoides fastidiosum]UUD37414.1 glycine--tRNA ligase [Mycoplasmoides fastidiosum]